MGFIYFENIYNEQELKERYKQLARENHPDKGGDIEVMKAINVEYDELLRRLLTGQGLFGTNLEDEINLGIELREKIALIQALEGVNLELCGSWLWLTGQTKQHKDRIKSYGFKWATKKEAWYYHQGYYRRFGGKQNYTMDEIRYRHGSLNFNRNGRKQYAIGG